MSENWFGSPEPSPVAAVCLTCGAEHTISKAWAHFLIQGVGVNPYLIRSCDRCLEGQSEYYLG